jgi:hypothetical protein
MADTENDTPDAGDEGNYDESDSPNEVDTDVDLGAAEEQGNLSDE